MAKEEAGLRGDMGYIADKLKAAEREVVTKAQHALATIRTDLERLEQRADLTWKELQMALADMINDAAQQIAANTAAMATATAAATAPEDTSALHDQIASLQAELDAANGALTNIHAALAEQSAKLTPPSPEATAEAPTEEPAPEGSNPAA